MIHFVPPLPVLQLISLPLKLFDIISASVALPVRSSCQCAVCLFVPPLPVLQSISLPLKLFDIISVSVALPVRSSCQCAVCLFVCQWCNLGQCCSVSVQLLPVHSSCLNLCQWYSLSQPLFSYLPVSLCQCAATASAQFLSFYLPVMPCMFHLQICSYRSMLKF